MENIRSLTGMAENMRKLRKIKRLTQEELAYRTGLHPYFIGLIERKTKTPSLESMEKIACALDVSVAELVSGDEPRGPDIYDARGREAAHVLGTLRQEDAEALLIMIKFVVEKFVAKGRGIKARAAEGESAWVTKKNVKRSAKH